MQYNPALAVDFYKVGHIFQYPKGTEYICSNLTPRSGKYSNVPNDGKVVVAGLWAAVNSFEMFWEEFFQSSRKIVDLYFSVVESAIGPMISKQHMYDLHDYGRLPVEIRLLPEGTVVPYGTPVLSIMNTDPKFFWVVNYLETALSAVCWKPLTTATTAYTYRKMIDKFLAETSDNPEFAWWQCHDFSARGMSGYDDAAMSGIGHLFSFRGTDTVSAIERMKRFYDTNGELVGGSVPATEHSVMAAGGFDSEINTYERLITEVYPSGIVSIVSDTWDYWQVLTDYTVRLKDKILARDGKVVFRPDSGDPVKIICGDPDADPSTPEFKGSVMVLDSIFGHTVNSKGYKVLNPKVGLIYGDSITYDRANQILTRLKANGWSSENIVFGVGSYTYQNVTRDTHGFAVKATWAQINGVSTPIFKQPKTDSGKNSHRGLLMVTRDASGNIVTRQNVTLEEYRSDANLLSAKYNSTSLADVRKALHG
jgi:nicotinamide phosphoribosyltransferase